MPAGTRISIRREPRRRPSPPQVLQGLSTTRPSPPHAEQGRVTVRKPCEKRWRPRPPQEGQLRGCDPFSAPDPEQGSHGSSRDTTSGASTPKAASRKEISIR